MIWAALSLLVVGIIFWAAAFCLCRSAFTLLKQAEDHLTNARDLLAGGEDA